MEKGKKWNAQFAQRFESGGNFSSVQLRIVLPTRAAAELAGWLAGTTSSSLDRWSSVKKETQQLNETRVSSHGVVVTAAEHQLWV